MPKSFRTLLAAAAAATAAHCLLGGRLDGLALSVAARRLGGGRANDGPRRVLEEAERAEQPQHHDVFTGQVTDDTLVSSIDMSEPLIEGAPRNGASVTDAALRVAEAVGPDDVEDEETMDALFETEVSNEQLKKEGTSQGVAPTEAAPHREAQEQTDPLEKPPQHVEELPMPSTALNSATAAVATDGVAETQLADSEGASQRLLAEANLGDNIAQALGTAGGRLAGGLTYLLSAFQPLTTEEHEEDVTNKGWVGKPVFLRPVLDAAEVARRLGVNEGVARDLVRAVRQLFPLPLPVLASAEPRQQTVETVPKLRSVNSETTSAEAIRKAEGKQRRLQVKYASEDVDELFELENIRLIGERLIDLIKPLFVVPRGVGGYIIGDHKGDAYTATGGATLWTKPLFDLNIFKPSGSSTASPDDSSSTTGPPDGSSTSTDAPASSSSTAATANSSSSTAATPASTTPATTP